LADHDLPGFDAFCDAPLELPFLPVRRIDQVLRSQGRQFIDLLVDLYSADMRSDSAMALAETLISLRYIRLGDAATEADLKKNLTSPDAAFRALAAELREQRNFVALFALRAVSITDGGLRETTLVRLVGQWRKLARSDERQFDLPELSVSEARQALDCLRPILWRGPDEPVPGLDHLNEPFVYLDEEGGDNSLSNQDRLRSFDLRSSELRESVIKEFITSVGGPEAFTLMHRLFAEEALRQQTHAMRHAEWRGSADPRYYRRLFQMLFHGYASLSLGPERPGPMNDAAPTVLPPNATSAYRRLYSIFFRRLLEDPPHYDLSRSLGLDGLKVELTRLAMNADQRPRVLWQSLYTEEGGLRPRYSQFLPVTKESGPVNTRILVEQHFSLARAALEADRLGEARQAVNGAERLLHDSSIWQLPSEELNGALIKAKKLQVDIGIIGAPARQAESIQEALNDCGFGASSLSAIRYLQECTAGAAAPEEAESILHDRTKDFVMEHCIGVSSARLADWSDFLCRLAEVATSSDDDHDGDRLALRYRAFVIFYLAERMRREAFDREPLGRTFVVSNHSTRVLVRTALQIVRGLTPPASVAPRNSMPSRRFFLVFARRHIDLLTRYSARYPSERPSILILQATYTRSVGGFSIGALRSALRLLHEADMLMFTTPDRPRVRRRLLLERAKVLRALATVAAFATDARDREARPMWWKMAVLDVVRLWRLTIGRQSIATPTSLWQRAIADQAASLRRMRQDLGLSAGGMGLDDDDWTELNQIREVPRGGVLP
jgi:hypothetical protein